MRVKKKSRPVLLDGAKDGFRDAWTDVPPVFSGLRGKSEKQELDYPWSAMSSVESSIQSFIIRIWVEEMAGSSDSLLWRGHITHVPTGQKQYLKDLEDIQAFVVPYLIAMGVKVQWPPQ